MIPDDLIERAEAGQIDALAELDARGLIPGNGETHEHYMQRLRCLRERIGDMKETLERDGSYTVDGIALQREDQIPNELFEEVRPMLEAKYRFMADWVPGFFVDPKFGWLFGGCAFYFYPEFFALFIIRKSFREKNKWLIYDRRELLVHELCHVARAAIGSRRFEEHLAYQTSASAFRRLAGGVFHSPLDSALLLGSTLLLLCMQMVKTLLAPTLWIWPFWTLVLLVIAMLCMRSRTYRRLLNRAVDNVQPISADPEAIVFRCTDGEIAALAGQASAGQAAAWLDRKADEELRWNVIRHRFVTAGAARCGSDAAP